MSAITHKNLQELCRACLTTLKENNVNISQNKNQGCGAETSDFNSLLWPNLCKLFFLLTTYDVNKEYDDFPKHLCELCYGRLLDYDEFRKLAVRSTEMLYKKWYADKEEIFVTDGNSGIERLSTRLPENITLDEDVDRNYDDKLLLPELANMPFYIKPEPVFEGIDSQLELPCNLEHDENNKNKTYKSHDTEEDADDEELLLSNGAANNSSPSINANEGKVVFSKKDRDRKSLHCNVCNKKFYKQVYLEAHVRRTHMGEEKPFHCSNCSKGFTRYNQLFLHMKSKHVEMLFQCDFENCDASFALDIKLKLHRQVAHHFSDEIISQTKQKRARHAYIELETDHICYLCKQKYSSKRALREHIKRHKNIKTHICQECGVAKVTRTELVTHMRTHTPNLEKFPCPQCPQVFNHKNAISRHVKVVHEGLRRFKCGYCSRRFGTRNSQVCHERLHTGEKPFICEICKKGFVQPEGLRSHMKYHKEILRNHVCKHCSQQFITLKNVIDHEKEHLCDKGHICNMCKKRFHNDLDLKNHCKIHLEATELSIRRNIMKNQTDGFS